MPHEHDADQFTRFSDTHGRKRFVVKVSTPMLLFRTRALAALGATVGFFVLPALYILLDNYGPSSRVAVYSYFLPASTPLVLFSALLGLSLGGEAYAFLKPSLPRYSVLRLSIGSLLGGFALLMVLLVVEFGSLQGGTLLGVLLIANLALVPVGMWIGGVLLVRPVPDDGPRQFPRWRLVALAVVLTAFLVPELRAFPSSGSVAVREAWARHRVREFPGLVEIVRNIPAITQDVGRVSAVAPTGTDKHVVGIDMNGNDLRFKLDVIGERGAGTLQVVCTIDQDRLLSWDSGRWSFNGREKDVVVQAHPYGEPASRSGAPPSPAGDPGRAD
jgi:MFS family permease